MMDSALHALDLKHSWHPCSQMKTYEISKPLIIQRAYGSIIELSTGARLIDAISSWWCKSLGHNHPVLKSALIEQLHQFEHVIFADTTHEKIARLSQMLSSLMPGLNKVFYAGDGSSAVEIALKMCIHARFNEGKPSKKRFVALRHGYHGETLGALSMGDLGRFRVPYAHHLLEPIYIDVPYVLSVDDIVWHDATQAWEAAQTKLEPFVEDITAIILEPIMQGAGGMKLYSQDFLKRLMVWARSHDIYVIADEIMTGMARTGKMLACEHAAMTPDILCLSKGLTSGFLPFSAVITTTPLYEIFYDDVETDKAFLHSHTYSGHALGAAVAVAALEVIQAQHLCERAQVLQTQMMRAFREIAEKTGRLINLRGIGAIVAADLKVNKEDRYAGHAVARTAMQHGALLRPLGNTIYWLPPLILEDETLEELKDITLRSILFALGGLS